MANGASIAANVIFAIGVIVQIVAVATSRWVYASFDISDYLYDYDYWQGDVAVGYGLFKGCVSYGGFTHCVSLDSLATFGFQLYDWWKAVQALEIIGIIGYGICIIALLVMRCAKTVNLKILVGVIGILTGISIAIGVGIFGGKHAEEFQTTGDDVEEYLDFSFYLACVAAILALVAGIIAFFIKENINATPQYPTNVIVMQPPAQPYAQQGAYPAPSSQTASHQYAYPAGQAQQYPYNPQKY